MSPTICIRPAQVPAGDFHFFFFAGPSTATGRPLLVIVIDPPRRSISSRNAEHFALNSVALTTRSCMISGYRNAALETRPDNFVYPQPHDARPTRVRLLCACALFLPLASAQLGPPRIGHIEFYGLRKLPEARVRKLVGVQSGDPLPPSKGAIEDRLEKLPDVVLARLEAVCCDEKGDVTLFIGVEEKGAPHFALRSEPSGNAVLPQQIVDKYRKLTAAIEAAARRGSTAEDLTQGHALMADPDARDLQQDFAAVAADQLPLLRDVLRNCADAEQRAIAATIIGYAPDKTKVVNDLEYTMQDPEETVRANAMRALTAIAVLAVREPKLGIRISPTWFIEMLNSIVLSDRVKAAAALVNLTEKDAGSVLAQIRDRALASVLEMAQWKNLRYALPSYILLGRIAGVDEPTIQESWSKGDRDVVVMKLAQSKRPPGRRK